MDAATGKAIVTINPKFDLQAEVELLICRAMCRCTQKQDSSRRVPGLTGMTVQVCRTGDLFLPCLRGGLGDSPVQTMLQHFFAQAETSLAGT